MNSSNIFMENTVKLTATEQLENELLSTDINTDIFDIDFSESESPIDEHI